MKNLNYKSVLVIWLVSLTMLIGISSKADKLTLINDNFADGDFTKSPSWSAVKIIHGNNSFFVSEFDNKKWIGTRRMSSLGTCFRNPNDNSSEVVLDSQQKPITISFLVRFDEISEENIIGVYLIGKNCHFLFRFTASGSGLIRWIAHPKERVPVKSIGVHLSPFNKGNPVKIELKYGGKSGVTISIGDEIIFNLPEKDHPLISKFGSEFGRFALFAKPSDSEKNPSVDSEKSPLWITDITVQGYQETITKNAKADLSGSSPKTKDK